MKFAYQICFPIAFVFAFQGLVFVSTCRAYNATPNCLPNESVQLVDGAWFCCTTSQFGTACSNRPPNQCLAGETGYTYYWGASPGSCTGQTCTNEYSQQFVLAETRRVWKQVCDANGSWKDDCVTSTTREWTCGRGAMSDCPEQFPRTTQNGGGKEYPPVRSEPPTVTTRTNCPGPVT